MKIIGAEFKLRGKLTTKKNAFAAGDTVTVTEVAESKSMLRWVVRAEDARGRRLVLTVGNASVYLEGFPRPPSTERMTEWLTDGVAKSIGGARVEPDGTDPKGLPSWLMALDYI